MLVALVAGGRGVDVPKWTLFAFVGLLTASPASGLRYAARFGLERGLKVPGRGYRRAASLMVLYTVSLVVPAGVPLVVYVEQNDAPVVRGLRPGGRGKGPRHGSSTVDRSSSCPRPRRNRCSTPMPCGRRSRQRWRTSAPGVPRCRHGSRRT